MTLKQKSLLSQNSLSNNTKEEKVSKHLFKQRKKKEQIKLDKFEKKELDKQEGKELDKQYPSS